MNNVVENEAANASGNGRLQRNMRTVDRYVPNALRFIQPLQRSEIISSPGQTMLVGQVCWSNAYFRSKVKAGSTKERKKSQGERNMEQRRAGNIAIPKPVYQSEEAHQRIAGRNSGQRHLPARRLVRPFLARNQPHALGYQPRAVVWNANFHAGQTFCCALL
jgi:hypothetical protein